jgi:hypothetical protein
VLTSHLAALSPTDLACWFFHVDYCVLQALNESGSFNAQELSLVCWALARLGHTPPVSWVVSLLSDGLELQGGLAGQSVVLLLQALVRWDLPELKEAGKYR